MRSLGFEFDAHGEPGYRHVHVFNRDPGVGKRIHPEAHDLAVACAADQVFARERVGEERLGIDRALGFIEPSLVEQLVEAAVIAGAGPQAKDGRGVSRPLTATLRGPRPLRALDC